MLKLLSAFLLTVLVNTATAQNLEVWFLDVGQSDATLVIGPTGKTFLFDGGSNGEGSGIIVPKLRALGINQLDIVSASHYHSDHVGGLDEVWNAGIHATVCYDRGDQSWYSTGSSTDYRNAYSSVRQTVTAGQIVDLGGGATLKCISVYGQLSNGQSVNINSSSQHENSCSISWKLEYGDFDMWVGGDLTGGGNNTADVETKAGQACGNVDVYQVNHHASRTSTNYSFVSSLQPEFVVIPCGSNNSYGYPKQDVMDRLNKSSRVIPVWSLSDGVGTEGYVDVNGHVHLTSDGSTYTVTSANGTTFTSHCDEQSLSSVAAGDVVVAEYMANPSRVNDSEGEWVEISGARESEAISMRSLSMTDAGSNSMVFGATIQLEAGDELLVGADGLPSRNGGITPIMVWPTGSFSMADSTDAILLKYGATTIDSVNYTSSYPGGSGISAERLDLLGDSSAANFTAAVSTYGSGDKGTPGDDNDADTTNWSGGGPTDSYIEIISPPMLGQRLEMNWHIARGEYAAGAMYQGFLTQGTTPGITLNGTHIPANLDTAYGLTSVIPGWSGYVPASELVAANTMIPNNNAYRGLTVYGIFVTYKVIAFSGIDIRSVASPVAMIIW
ncbi:MAG: MBL fold metallo-hydrolase [Planctomycetes bacterium]|nr:MBL fold metallo-hydrolase [Planctomycetota bacterium]MBT4029849.1 MBL fold metallo-hydrolase [Planctomycetota bacterium]MBT5100288.1 MBL fold metallo-hydrolase [Planctomycetota bacterium]MBT7012112.1 MBL fold metallo-hydrolase [Planctomycetota bacterium]MBT7318266.1 MBL fold metallo-hydrolase [Planctomycetota bacterium]